MLDGLGSFPFVVTFECVRYKASFRPHILDDGIMYVVFKGEVFEFIGCGRTNNGIVLCDSRQ